MLLTLHPREGNQSKKHKFLLFLIKNVHSNCLLVFMNKCARQLYDTFLLWALSTFWAAKELPYTVSFLYSGSIVWIVFLLFMSGFVIVSPLWEYWFFSSMWELRFSCMRIIEPIMTTCVMAGNAKNARQAMVDNAIIALQPTSSAIVQDGSHICQDNLALLVGTVGARITYT